MHSRSEIGRPKTSSNKFIEVNIKLQKNGEAWKFRYMTTTNWTISWMGRELAWLIDLVQRPLAHMDARRPSLATVQN